MTFLNPLYLIGLVAAGIPIILHLLNLRKARVVEFSTLKFLKELQRSKIRKLKIRQWLLLALRTLIVIFIVLAFTRPAMQSAFGFLPGTEAKSSIVIVLDNSYSMLGSDDKGQILKQAKEKALEIIDNMSPGDEAVLITASQAHVKEREFTAALNAVRKEILAVQPSAVHAYYGDLFAAVSVVMDKSSNLNKEVYLITDDQGSQYVSSTEETAGALFQSNVKLLVFPLGTRVPDNASVTDVSVKNVLFEAGKPVDVSATIANAGDRAINDAVVSVFLNGERVNQKPVQVAPGGSQTIEFSVIPKDAGLIEGFVELEADDIPEDNRRYFSFSIPERIRVLLAPSESKQALVLRLALEPQQGSEEDGLYRIDEMSAGALRSANFTNYDVVILAGVNGSISESFTGRLAAYVRGGGGLMIFPDASGNLDAFSTAVLPALDLPAPLGTNGTAGNRSTYTTFGKIDFDHPLFRNVFAENRTNEMPTVESPHIYYSVRLRGTNQSQTVVASSNGDGFLIDQHVGAGKALVYGTAADFAWSDFPVKGIFVPLVNRSVLYLASAEYQSVAGIAGESFDVQLPAGSVEGKIYELIAPGGVNTRIVPRMLMSGKTFSIDQPQQPGVYTITADATPVWKFPVNINPAESDAEKVDGSQRDAFFTTLGIQQYDVLDRDADVQQAVAQIRYGVELWKYFILLALLCAVAEMFIARDVKRRAVEVQTVAIS